ncbi:MAG: hypothetical protein IPI12_13215 [Ignavibacteriales bacterium]|nr:hypothetical protein [Ignavibacteriales bacterium]
MTVTIKGFAGLSSRECYSCHQPNFEAAKNPDHVLGIFQNNARLATT